MKKQTAVEWLLDTMSNSGGMEQPDIDRVFKQALEMEKQQIMDAHFEGSELYRRQHYKETYKD